MTATSELRTPPELRGLKGGKRLWKGSRAASCGEVTLFRRCAQSDPRSGKSSVPRRAWEPPATCSLQIPFYRNCA